MSAPTIVHEQIIVQAGGDIEQEWLRQLQQRDFVLPLRTHEPVGFCQATPDFFFKRAGVAVYVDGADGERAARDADLVDELEDEGIFVVRFGPPERWDDVFRRNAGSFKGE